MLTIVNTLNVIVLTYNDTFVKECLQCFKKLYKLSMTNNMYIGEKIINYLLCVIHAQIVDLNFCKSDRIQY